MISISGLHKSYGRLEVLNGIDLRFENGQSVAIIGPNGSGKTTLIKCIVGLVQPKRGDIRINGTSVLRQWKYREQISYLPQVTHFPPNLRVREVIRMIRDLRPGSSRAEELISIFSMKAHLNKRIGNLSGGSRQKLNVILCLMYDSPIMIMDEPSTGLDPLSLVRFKDFISANKDQERIILFTTHIMSLVEEMADRVVFLLDGQVKYIGTPAELLTTLKETSVERAIARLLTSREEAHA